MLQPMGHKESDDLVTEQEQCILGEPLLKIMSFPNEVSSILVKSQFGVFLCHFLDILFSSLDLCLCVPCRFYLLLCSKS